MSYLFVYEKEKFYLAFTTQGGHITGDLMKNIENISPRAIEEMKAEIAKDNTIGRVIWCGQFVFIITRKHYNSKPNAAEFVSMLGSLPADKIFKTTKEIHPVYANVFSISNFYNIEVYDSSDWDYGRKYFKKLKTAK
jgi:hypothetical protein